MPARACPSTVIAATRVSCAFSSGGTLVVATPRTRPARHARRLPGGSSPAPDRRATLWALLALASGAWAAWSGALAGPLERAMVIAALGSSVLWPLARRHWPAGAQSVPDAALDLVFLADGRLLAQAGSRVSTLVPLSAWVDRRQLVIRLAAGSAGLPRLLRIERAGLDDECRWRQLRRWHDRQRSTVRVAVPAGG